MCILRKMSNSVEKNRHSKKYKIENAPLHGSSPVKILGALLNIFDHFDWIEEKRPKATIIVAFYFMKH